MIHHLNNDPGAARCPRCPRDLERAAGGGAVRWSCAGCGGAGVTVAALRQFAPADRVNRLWREAWHTAEPSSLACAACGGAMRRARIAAGGGALELDACRACQSIWFDPGELATFSPERQAPPAAEAPLPEAARRALGSAMASEIATDARERRRARQFADALTGGRRRRSGHWLADALIALCQA